MGHDLVQGSFALCLIAAPVFAQKAGAAAPPVRTTPLGNLVQIEGMRENQLLGYGLVVLQQLAHLVRLLTNTPGSTEASRV